MSIHDIDRVARHLVDTEPPPNLETRILARLDAAGRDATGQERPSEGWTWWMWRAALPAALATIAIVMGTRNPKILAPNGVQGTEVLSPQPVADFSRIAKLEPQPGRASVGTGKAAEGISTRTSDTTEPRLSSEEAAWMDRRILMLAAVEALRVEHLSFDPLNSAGSTQPEALAITPLIMTPLPLEPLGSGRHNDR
ncbi:MAG: anti-sigma factor [Acidobacteria bacterium]|jgi:hypothetical protein|nr:anti-sigma factor [Acidobacteriota bacterium]